MADGFSGEVCMGGHPLRDGHSKCLICGLPVEMNWMRDASPPAEAARTGRLAVWIGSIIALVAAALGYGLVSAPAQAESAEIVRVIDGDTVVATARGRTFKVRILNIDTPETKDPNRPVECLGKEATAETSGLLPPGTHVRLTHDQVRRDRFGRVLANIQLDNGVDVGTALARQGLAVPLVVGPNSAHIGRIRSAFDEAEQSQRGFFDPNEACTVPGVTAAAERQVSVAEALAAGTTVAAALSAFNRSLAIANGIDNKYRAVLSDETALAFKAVRISGSLPGYLRRLKAAVRDSRAVERTLDNVSTDRIAAAKRARDARMAAQEARRIAAQAAAQAAARRAAEAAARRAADAYNADDSDSDSGDRSRGSSGNKARNRCYAPGGRTFHYC